MKTKYRHIHFTDEGPLMSIGDGRRRVWFCRNNKSDDILGTCTWYVVWRRYVFTGEEIAVFDAGCLRDIASFLQEATQEARP